MTHIDPVDRDELADGARISAEDMQAMLEGTADERIQRPAAAFLEAYRLANWLGFSTRVALVQADAAWDRAIEDLDLELTPFAVVLN